MPDSFEHMPTVAVRMPNGALTSLAGNIDPQHNVAVSHLILVQKQVRTTIEQLLRDVDPQVICSLVPLKELYCPFMFPGFSQRRKRAQVAALPGFRILFPRIQPVLSGFQFADHAF